MSDGLMAGMLLFDNTDGPFGAVSLRNVEMRNLGDAGFWMSRNGPTGGYVELENVTMTNTGTEAYTMFGAWPIQIDGGGVVLKNVVVNDAVERPFLYSGWGKPFYASNITGDVTVNSNNSFSCTPYYNNATSTGNNIKVTCNVAPSPPPSEPPPQLQQQVQLLPPARFSRNTFPYGDPAGGCLENETAILVPGYPGGLCSPSCDPVTNYCPPIPSSEFPNITRATGECVIRLPGQWKPMQCAIVCDADAAICPGEQAANMSAGSLCLIGQGSGLCLYHTGCTVWPGLNCSAPTPLLM